MLRILIVVITFSFLALGAAGQVKAEEIFVITDHTAGRQLIISFDSASPGTTREPILITGLEDFERVEAFDFLPSDGKLYALVSGLEKNNKKDQTNSIYTIEPMTGVATHQKRLKFPLEGSFDFTFNPATLLGRLIISTGAVKPKKNKVRSDSFEDEDDFDLEYAAGDVNAGKTPFIVGSAFDAAGAWFGIETSARALVTQSPGDEGKLVTVGPLGTTGSGVGGFDISSSTGAASAGRSSSPST